MRYTPAFALVLTACLTVGCEEKATTTGSGSSSSSPAPTPAWMLASMPEGASPVGEVKKSAAEGEEVVILGRIGGSATPITKGSATFLIVDPSVPSCDQIPGDNCKKPWDYCCEPKESLTANSATVQVVGEDGATLTTDLESLGLKPLDEVIVVGTVGPRPSDQVLVIKATGVHRVASGS